MDAFQLLVTDGKHEGMTYSLKQGGNAYTIGRDPTNNIRITDSGVSRQHARLYIDNGIWHIEDMGSRNGVYVGQSRIESCTLTDGDAIKIGAAKFKFFKAGKGVRMTDTGLIPVHDTPGKSDTPKPPSKKSAGGQAPQEHVDMDAIKRLHEAHDRIMAQVSRIIVGQQEIIEQLLITLFAKGHCLMVGVPGLAKTLMVRTLAGVLNLDTNRIQFTPDLMPTDITGTDILEEDQATGRREFKFIKGPLFTNLLLADEINRTPPKTQAALLEAMQEYRVTTGGITYTLPQPFFVLATQNPLEQEGTYPLPEAQLDRFMFFVEVNYPSRDEEVDIIQATTTRVDMELDEVLNGEEILGHQESIRKIPVSQHVVTYAADLVRATRPEDDRAPKFVKEWLSWGAGPRAGQYLVLAAKSRAALQGRYNITTEDIRANALPVLRHRMFCNFNASSEGIKPRDVIKKLLETVQEPSAEDYRN